MQLRAIILPHSINNSRQGARENRIKNKVIRENLDIYEVMQNKWEHTHTPTNTYINLRSQTYNLKISVSSKNKAFM